MQILQISILCAEGQFPLPTIWVQLSFEPNKKHSNDIWSADF